MLAMVIVWLGMAHLMRDRTPPPPVVIEPVRVPKQTFIRAKDWGRDWNTIPEVRM
jgi:hypothetical protein